MHELLVATVEFSDRVWFNYSMPCYNLRPALSYTRIASLQPWLRTKRNYVTRKLLFILRGNRLSTSLTSQNRQMILSFVISLAKWVGNELPFLENNHFVSMGLYSMSGGQVKSTKVPDVSAMCNSRLQWVPWYKDLSELKLDHAFRLLHKMLSNFMVESLIPITRLTFLSLIQNGRRREQIRTRMRERYMLLVSASSRLKPTWINYSKPYASCSWWFT